MTRILSRDYYSLRGNGYMTGGESWRYWQGILLQCSGWLGHRYFKPCFLRPQVKPGVEFLTSRFTIKQFFPCEPAFYLYHVRAPGCVIFCVSLPLIHRWWQHKIPILHEPQRENYDTMFWGRNYTQDKNTQFWWVSYVQKKTLGHLNPALMKL